MEDRDTYDFNEVLKHCLHLLPILEHLTFIHPFKQLVNGIYWAPSMSQGLYWPLECSINVKIMGGSLPWARPNSLILIAFEMEIQDQRQKPSDSE